VFLAVLSLKVTNALGLLVILRIDLITLLRRSHELEERALRRSELEELGSLTASIEHDLKTPLGLINLQIVGMKRAYQANPKIMNDLDRIEDATARIYAVTQIIPALRASKEYYEQLMVRVNISDVIGRSIKTIKSQLDISNVIFKFEGRDYYIKANPQMLETAIENILKNSVEAIIDTNRDRGLIEIFLRKARDKKIELVILDNGCGIAAENLPKLTTLFTTKNNLKANSGIGLFIANRIVRFHQGELRVSSEAGKSTKVSIILPVSNPMSARLTASDESPAPAS